MTGDDKNNNQKQVKFDNLYDILFNEAGNPKHNTTKKAVLGADKLDFLES